MERDRRLTGTLRGQTDKPDAPAGFEFSNGWRVCSAYFYRFFSQYANDIFTDGEAFYLIDGHTPKPRKLSNFRSNGSG